MAKPLEPLTPAILHNAPLSRRVWARLCQPPRWAATLDLWSFFGALPISVLFNLSVAASLSGCKCEVGHDSRYQYLELLLPQRWPGPGESILALLAFVVCALFIAVPFRISAWLYLSLSSRSRRLTAVAWTMGFHLTAHALVVGGAGMLDPINVSLAVALTAVWGLWLARLPRPYDAAQLPGQLPAMSTLTEPELGAVRQP